MVKISKTVLALGALGVLLLLGRSRLAGAVDTITGGNGQEQIPVPPPPPPPTTPPGHTDPQLPPSNTPQPPPPDLGAGLTNFFNQFASFFQNLVPGQGSPTAETITQEQTQVLAEQTKGLRVSATTEEAALEALRKELTPPKRTAQAFAPVDRVTSFLPTGQQFGFGGTFQGGIVTENPIDTLSEIISNFPQLSASQAADLLAQIRVRDKPLFPSEVKAGLVDPDIRNIVAAGGDIVRGTQVQITPSQQQTMSIRESEAKRAACLTCEMFGLNCPICSGQMAAITVGI